MRRALAAFWDAPSLPAAIEAIRQEDRTGVLASLAIAGANAAELHRQHSDRGIGAGVSVSEFVTRSLRSQMVTFILTAPLFHQAVPIDLPRVDANRLDDRPKVVSVAIDIDAVGQVFVDGLPIDRSELAGRLAEVAGGQPELHLRADQETRYERVTEVLADAQRAGLVRIAFETEPLR